MNRWFRFYSDAIRNPKVARLSDSDFRLWVRLLSVAAENEGALPSKDDLRHLLMMRLDHLSKGLDRLIKGGLMDVLGDGYEPHNWSKFQYKSDTSTERVHKHRAKRNVSETAPDSETDTDTEVVAKATTARTKRKAEFKLPIDVPSGAWEAFEGMRRRIGKPMTDYARRLAVAKLRALAEDGYPPGDVLDQSTMNSWQSLYPIKDDHNGRNGQSNFTSGGIRGTRPDPAVDMYRRACAQLEAEGFVDNPEDRRGDWLSLSSHGSG